jgi:hypothetical protein
MAKELIRVRQAVLDTLSKQTLSGIILYLLLSVFVNLPTFKNGWLLSSNDMVQATASTFQQTEYLKTFGSLPYWFAHIFCGVPRDALMPGLSQLILVPPSLILGPVWAIKLYNVLIFTFSAAGMMLLTAHLSTNRRVQILSGVMYTLNPLFIRILFASPYQTLELALLPVLLLSYLRAVDWARWDYAILAGSLSAIVLQVHPQYFMIFGIMMIIYAAFSLVSRRANGALTFNGKKAAIVSLVFLIGLIVNSAWLAKVALQQSAYVPFSSPEEVRLWSLTYIGALSFWQLAPLFEDIFVGIALPPQTGFYGVVIAALSFLGLVLKRNRYTAYFGIATITSILLSLGENGPFDYYGLLRVIPYFSTIRTPVRFLTIAVLSSAYLSSITMEKLDVLLARQLQRSYSRLSRRWHALSAKLPLLLTVMVVVYLVCVSPFAFQFSSSVGEPPSRDLQVVYDMIRNDQSDVRVAGYPILTDLPPGSWNYDFGLSRQAPETLSYVFHGKRVFWGPTKALATGYMQTVGNFLQSAIARNALGNHVGEVLGYYGIKYLIVYRELTSPRTLDYLLNQESLVLRFLDESTALLENLDCRPRIYEGVGTLVVGGPGVLSSLANLELRSSPLVLLTPTWPYPPKELLHSTPNVIFQNGEFFDFVTMFIDRRYFFEAENFGDSGLGILRGEDLPYHKDLIYGDKFAMVTNHTPLEVPFEVTTPGPVKIKVRVLCYPGAKRLSALVDNTMISGNLCENVTDFANEWTFRWIELQGMVLDKGEHVLKLVPISGSFGIDCMVIAPLGDLVRAYKQAIDAIAPHRVIYLLEAEDIFDVRGTGWSIGNTLSDGSWSYASNSEFISTYVPSAVRTSLFVPRSGMYALHIRHMNMDFNERYPAVSIAVNGDTVGTIHGNVEVDRWFWESFAPLYIHQGENELSISNINGWNAIDELVIESCDVSHGVDSGTAHNTSWQQTSLDSFILRSGTHPGEFEVLTESYNPLWEMNDKERMEKSTTAFWCLNAFYQHDMKEPLMISYRAGVGAILNDYSTLLAIALPVVYVSIRHLRRATKRNGGA